MKTVAVCVCTFKRPAGLRRLLKSLEALETTNCVKLIVGDNDPVGLAGSEVIQSLISQGYRWPIRAFPIQERGLASARNAVVSAALEDHAVTLIALLDDDEYVEPQWLTNILATMMRTSADIVGGAVLSVFESPPQPWHTHCIAYLRDDTTEGVVDELYGAGNLLISRDLLENLDRPLFDSAFAFTGGEDALFLKQARLKGARFARSARAVAYESYPTERMTEAWVLQRAYRIGTTEMKIRRKLGMNWQKWMGFWVRLPFAVMLASFRVLIPSSQAAYRINMKFALYRELGKLADVLGYTYEEYR